MEPDEALDEASKAKKYQEAVSGLPELTFFTFYESLALIYLSLIDGKSDHLKKINKNLKSLKKWADTSPSNYKHQYLLIQAGYQFLKDKNISKSLPLFEQATQLARQEKYIQLEAMAYELAARCYFSENMKIHAQMHIQWAYNTFLLWGAKRKAAMLRSEFSFIDASIPDASSHQKWLADNYIKRTNTKSVLCTLIKNQGKVIAAMYLENNLATNSFTEERIELLNILSGQIAISIENARLYSNLEIRVEERTKELQKKTKQIEKQNHKLEKTLQQSKAMQNQLIHSEKMASLGELTAGIAHEIKNPLNFVTNFSELSIDLLVEMFEELNNGMIDGASETAKFIMENLEKINNHGKRADSIVKSMLLHSRGGSGHIELTRFNSLIKEYVNLAFHGMRAGKKPINVDIRLELDETIDEVPLFAEDFNRVVLNICNNAFDAMRDKLQNTNQFELVLTIRTSKTDKNIILEIGDNGPGIPYEIKAKILHPFFSTKKGTQGTGLGLSITHDIVKAHGGTMEVSYNAPGAIFKVILPKKGKNYQNIIPDTFS